MLEDISQIPATAWAFSISAVVAAAVLLIVRRSATAHIRPALPAVALFVGVAGFLIGVGTWSLRERFHGHTHPEALLGLVLISLAGLALALRQRKAPRLSGTGTFAVEALALWAGNWLGCTAIHGGIWDDLVLVSIAGAVITVTLGALVVLIRPRSIAQQSSHVSA